MDEKQLQALAHEFAKNLKTPEDLNQFDRMLKKISVEAALNAEMTHHWDMKNISPNRALTPATATPQKTSPPPTDRSNCVLHAIVTAPSNRNW